MVFDTVFSMGGYSGVGSSVEVSEATKDVAASTTTAKNKLRDGGRSSKYGFMRNLLDRSEFLEKIREKDIVWGGAAGSKEAPHSPVDAPLSISSSRRSMTRRREDDASSANHMAPTTGSRSTAEGENDRDVRSSGLGRHESSSRRPPESLRKITEKPTDYATRLRGEKPPDSLRKITQSSRRLNLADSPRLRGEKLPDSPRKITKSSMRLSFADSPRLRGEKLPDSPRKITKSSRRLSLADSRRLRCEKPPETPWKITDSSRKLSLESPRNTPTSPRKTFIESPRKTPESQRKIVTSSPRKTAGSQRNRVSDSPRQSPSDSPRKTSSVSQNEVREATLISSNRDSGNADWKRGHGARGGLRDHYSSQL
jgi:hypothetical protein